MLNRKRKRAPIHNTAWNNIKKGLAECQKQGLDPVDAFETMVASGWQSIKPEYFSAKNKSSMSNSFHQWDVDSVMKA